MGHAMQVVKHSDIMVIAAKPQCVPAILEQIGAHVSKDHLIMCIAAGVRLSTLERSLPQARVVRPGSMFALLFLSSLTKSRHSMSTTLW
jgi:pyrroline-5-carboxylate reductase